MRLLVTLLTLSLLSACTPTSSTPPLLTPTTSSSSPAPSPIHPCRASTPTPRTDSNWPERHQRILNEVRKGNHEIAFLGASTIEFWPTTGKETWESTWLPRNAVNCGIGGDRTQHLLARMDSGLLDALAAPSNRIRWIVLNIGSNNSDVEPAADITAGTLAIIERLHQRLPEARIVVMLTTPRGRWPGPQRDTIAALNTRLKPLLAHDPLVHAIDLGDRFVLPTGELSLDLVPDAIHPTAEGYRMWTEALLKAMNWSF